MDEARKSCQQAVDEVVRAVNTGNLELVSTAAIHHLSTCRRCRAGLLLLVAGLAPNGNSSLPYACADCQNDLAAFIELELQDAARAARIYPRVWWHLCYCDQCARTYEFTHALLAAEHKGALRPLQHALPRLISYPVRKPRRIRLTRTMLGLGLPGMPMAFANTRGRTADDYVLFEEPVGEVEARRFTIAAQEQIDGSWQVVVTVTPPIDGMLVLTAGALRLAELFDADGTARLNNVAPSLLLDADAPDLEISIVPAEG